MKRVLLAEGLLAAELPDNWVIRAATHADGHRIEVAVPERYAEWELGHLPESLTTIVHPTTEPLQQFAEARMRRHVAQGEPETFGGLVGKVPARGYAWTDGVRDIASWFVQLANQVVVVIHVALPGLLEPRGTDRDPVARGRALLCSASWIN